MQDPFGREIDYLRLSITDRCNERCTYCLPQGYSDWLPKGEILTYEEILRVVRVAVDLGFRKFRVTGGEPLVRRGAVEFLEQLCAMQGVGSVGLTTNATRLAPLAGRLKAAGLESLNISLDALDPQRYHHITRGRLAEALAGLEAAQAAGFGRIKLNVVLMKGLNEQELWPLARFAAERGLLAVRYIELMPVSSLEMVGEDRFLSAAEARRILCAHDELEPLEERGLGHGPARYFRLKGAGTRVGFIAAMTDDHFCEACNKMRLTPDGFIRPCLGQHQEHDLKGALRGQGTDQALREVLLHALRRKPEAHAFREGYVPLRIMTAIGG